MTSTPRSAASARLRASGTLLGLLALVALFGALRPATFLSPVNAASILEQVSILAFIACVQTVVMVVGDFDLSVGALASLTGVMVAILLVQGVPVPLAVLAGLLLGALAGLVNGLLVAYVGLSAFIATLATMTAFSGLALLASRGTTIFRLPASFVALGQDGPGSGAVPWPVIFAVLVALVVWLALTRTTQGRRWYAVGGNAEAARLSGLRVNLDRLAAFVVSGAGAALAGILLTARLASAHPNAGDPFMLTSIAAVFLGMTLVRTGQANLPGTLVGIGILGVLSNGLNLLQVNSYIQQVLTGLIIIMAVSLSRLGRRRS